MLCLRDIAPQCDTRAIQDSGRDLTRHLRRGMDWLSIALIHFLEVDLYASIGSRPLSV